MEAVEQEIDAQEGGKAARNCPKKVIQKEAGYCIALRRWMEKYLAYNFIALTSLHNRAP